MKNSAKIVLLIMAFISSGCFKSAEKPSDSKSAESIYNYNFISINGEVIPLNKFKGKKILFVNVASECGFTPQYEGLEKLYRQYKNQVEVIGFPANDFMGQEPGTNEEIAAFCERNFGVTFTMSEKISVKGDNMHPVFKWLTSVSLNGWNNLEPQWNFYKYLVDENGELIKVFPSTTEPMSEDLLSYLY